MNVLGLIELPAFVIYPILAVILLLIHTRWKFSYWRKQGIPGPTPWPILGNITAFLSKMPVHKYDMINYKKFGKTYGAYEPTKNILMISDPEDMKSVLVKDFDVFVNRRNFNPGSDVILDNFLSVLRDEKWQLVRNAVTPTFSGSKLKKMTERVIDCCDTLRDCLVKIAQNEKEFDGKRLFGAYSLDVIASAAFKTNIKSLEDPDNMFVQQAKKVFDLKITLRFLLVLTFPKLATKLGIPFFEKSVLQFFGDVVKKIMKMRANETETGNDFLSLLLSKQGKSVKEDNEEMEDSDQEGDGITNVTDAKAIKEALTDEMILSQCILFFIAGYDTTATTLTMTAYNLTLYPECQNKLLEELDAAVEKHGGVTYDAIADMPYLNACVKETLRLYPPAIRTEREAGQNYQLGDIFLEKGTVVNFPIYCIHHDPDNWPDPETFDPERFMCDSSDINPYTYLPFGLGRRNCVAMRFALFEVKIALAIALIKVKFVKTPKTKYPPKLGGLGLLQPRDIFIGAVQREN